MAKITALSCSYVDVNAAVGQAVDGDTVVVPAGTQPWSSVLTINKAITLMGATTISDAQLVAGTANDQTIIQAHFLTGGTNAIIKLPSTQAGKSYRVTGFTFRDTGTNGGQGGVIDIRGSSTQVRIDHCHFDMGVGTPPKGHFKANVGVGDSVYGVADHNVIVTPGGLQPFFIDHGGASAQGYEVWAGPTDWGSANFWFIEDNYISLVGSRGLVDTTIGGREVVRYNHVHGGILSTVHGTEGQSLRGNRAIEVYMNDVHPTQVTTGGEARSGGVLFWGNTWDSSMLPNFALIQFRQIGRFGSAAVWSGSDGLSPWDVNADASMNPVAFGQPGHQFYPASGFGTCTNTTPSSGQLNDSSASWVNNHWIGYGVTRQSDGKCSLISGNNATTLFLVGNASLTANSETLWTNGDKYSIHHVLVSIDQSGRGQGDLLKKVGSTVTNTATNSACYPHQLLDPCYSWSNRQGTTHVDFVTDSIGRGNVTFQENRDYYNEAAAVGGVQTIGVGVGSFASRPASGVAGVDITGVTANPPGTAYWATDQNKLYVWRGGAWVLWYQPFVHPHILVVDAPTILSTSASFTQGTGGTFQAQASGFSAPPTWSETGTLPTGTTFSSSGLLTVGTGSPAGTYPITLHAVNGTESDDQAFTLTIQSSATKIIGLSGSLAFGDVDINSSSQKTVLITNSGNATLTVTNVTVPAGYVANWTSGTIAAGASQSVIVVFTPTSAGDINGTFTVVSDKTSGTNTMSVTGFGVTRIIDVSGNLAFGNVTVGQTATRQLTITNSGNRTLSIVSVAYPANFSGDFTTALVPAGTNKILNVSFSPAAAQSYGGTIDVSSNKTSGTNTIAATGVGVVAATKVIQLTGNLAFGTVLVGTTQTKVLSITNSGNAVLTVTGITYPTGFSGDWSSGTIAAGATQNVNVTFAPTSAISYGGTVTVTSNADSGTNTIAISGSGMVTSTKIIGLSGNLAFGNVAVNSTAIRTLTISNTGTANLTVTGLTLPTGFSGSFAGTIVPGGSQNVSITFAPLAATTYGGNITVNSDATSGTNTIATSGTGVAPITKVISITGNLSFGNVQRNHSVQKVMTISNSGTGDLTVTGITFPAMFSGNWSSGVIAPGTSQLVTVTFRPTDFGTFGGNITVLSDKTSGTNTIPCSGKGVQHKQVPFMLVVQ